MRAPRLLCLLLLAAAFPPAAPRAQAPAAGLTIPGLSAPVEIITDTGGIPHIRAASVSDVYAAWGWVSARDRGWQMLLTRAEAQGQTHLWFGNSALQADGGAQLFRLRERAAAIWARDSRDPATRMALERFADGVNQYFAQCRAGQRAWPAEVTRLHLDPAPWKPEDSVALMLGFGITLDLDVPEVSESRAMKEHGAEWVDQRRRFESQWPYTSVPDGAAPPAAGAHASTHTPALSQDLLAGAEQTLSPWPAREADASNRASNEFAVGGARTHSHKPVLANDPHLALGAPGPFYVLHVQVPGVMNAIGAGVPGLPLIASGNNERVAWGVTALSMDVVDAYADTLDASGTHVRVNGAWAPVTTGPFDLHFRVLGLEVPVPAFAQQRRYTPHGPVVSFDPKHHMAISLRWSAFEDSRVTLTRLIGIERSHDAAEVSERAGTLVTPTLNFAIADVDGDVRYRACGLIPRRPFAFTRGLLPSDGRHEWAGYVPADSMPMWRVPADRYVVNANNRPAGSNLHEGADRFDWAADRALRMAQRLEGDRDLTMADAASVQTDVYSRASARQVPALLHAVESLNSLQPRELAALDTLRRWDFMARRGRVAPTIARAWWNVLLRRSRTEGLPGLALAALEGRAPEALRQPGSNATEAPAVAARAALDTALDSLTAKLGTDMRKWTYGRVHLARFAHALSELDGRKRWEPPLTPEDGDGSTPCVGGTSEPYSVTVTHGPAYRHVVDLASPDSSIGIVPPYNSAEASVDLRQDWADHRYVPFLLDWARVRAHAANAVTLRAPLAKD
jgi:penicillin amidase